MKKHINNVMLLLLLMFGFSTSFAQDEKDIQAKIKMVQTDNLVSIFATVSNNTQTFQSELDYTLLSLTEGANGKLSKDSQSGEFTLKPTESIVLSSQKSNIDRHGKLKIFLFIRQKGALVSKDTLYVASIQDKFKNKNIIEEQIVISGLIVENVMTKPGKDFYELFTQIARMNNINYPFVIVVNEKPNLGGRNSEISLLVKEEEVFKFVTQPKEEYLQMAAKQANKALYQYNLKRQKLYKSEKLY